MKRVSTNQPQVNLGGLQADVEIAAKAFRSATTKLRQAQDNYVSAEDNYHRANKALFAGVTAVGLQNKIV